MVPLDVAATWTRMLSVSAGACAAAGAPGPATRLRGRPPDPAGGPWLAIFDFQPLTRAERQSLERWLRDRAEPLLMVRNVLLATPIAQDVFIELTPQALAAMPEGWRDAPRPILFFAPAGRSAPERRRQYLDALSRLRIPLASAGSELWAVRDFDADLMVALARLSAAGERAAFRAALDPGQTRLFDQQLPAVEAALLDDLVGARDEEDEVALDLASLSALHPAAHPLSLFAAVERAHNRRRPETARTQFSARTLEARLSARGYPERIRDCTDEFAARAPLLLPAELQRVFEAADLLAPDPA
jgi:hypothetical protein